MTGTTLRSVGFAADGARFVEAVNEIVEAHPEVPLVSDTGDCLCAAVEIQSNDCVAPAYYATMGFAVPAAPGLQVPTALREAWSAPLQRVCR